jgi:hypothetical protein
MTQVGRVFASPERASATAVPASPKRGSATAGNG